MISTQGSQKSRRWVRLFIIHRFS